MTCAEFQERAMDYALGVLDAAERAACEAHLREPAHTGCREALRRATAAVALIPNALEPVAPAPATWAAIEGRLAAPPLRARRRWATQAGWVVAAAAIVLIVALLRDRRELTAAAEDDQRRRAQCLAALEQQRGDAKLQQAAIAMLQRPGTRLVALAPQGGATAANLIFHADDTRVFVVASGLRAPPGKALQLWAVRGEQQIPEGVLSGDSAGAVHSGTIAAIRDGNLDAFGVTLEPAGGASGAHGPVVLYGKI